ncbi:biotin--[acetyl-CoA-carboxylase] ligase [uncultured Limosilactobacillus sp.]|uniref:biotin--[acetyl-CoA-carboxylase] ligase n=1 Tax=uncultured Limosilactobacillus sp. TaxID=2837629 RepID=UPI0025E066E7|nr:biotin--[acetyl-CoA-carboxylase] ligase [uncultured Limosilactobacillus sp.]
MQLSQKRIEQYLLPKFPGKVIVKQQVDSTQRIAKIMNNSSQPVAVLAESQTAGYGKQQRTFYSPRDSGLYLSVLIPGVAKAELKAAGLFTTGLAIAVTKVLEKNFPTKQLMVKWVNDIMLNHKKVAGILVEAVLEGQTVNWIVGIGINLSTTNFPLALQKKAGSIDQNQLVERNRLAAEIIEAVWQTRFSYQRRTFIHEYQQRLILLNRSVDLQLASRTITGVVRGINDEGELIIQQSNGRIKAISAGEVSKVNY